MATILGAITTQPIKENQKIKQKVITSSDPLLGSLHNTLSNWLNNPAIFGRELSSDEKKYLTPILGKMISLDAARVHPLTKDVMKSIGEEKTPALSKEDKLPYRTYYNKDMFAGKKGTYSSEEQEYLASVLGHEFTHAYQSVAKTPHAPDKPENVGYDPKDYDYGGIKGLSSDRIKGKKFFDYDSEKQAAIIEDYIDLNIKYSKTKDGKIKQKLLSEMNFYKPFLSDFSKAKHLDLNQKHPDDPIEMFHHIGTAIDDLVSGRIF